MKPPSFLDRMAELSRERVKRQRAREPDEALRERAMAMPDPPPLVLGEFSIIAELKLRSPAAGLLAQPDFDRNSQLAAYAGGGAAAISILTEPDEFEGELGHLEEAAAALRDQNIPAMRKDFLADPYQVLEARAAGAGGILVIVTMLSDEEVEALLSTASDCGLFVLLEGFDAGDLARIGALIGHERPGTGAPMLCGVNCRDLRSLEVNFGRFATLAEHLPAGVLAVAESGIDGVDEIRAVADLGYGAALVGSALMKSADPAEAVSRLVAAGAARRGEVRSCS